jgi:hypothetical protein
MTNTCTQKKCARLFQSTPYVKKITYLNSSWGHKGVHMRNQQQRPLNSEADSAFLHVFSHTADRALVHVFPQVRTHVHTNAHS